MVDEGTLSMLGRIINEAVKHEVFQGFNSALTLEKARLRLSKSFYRKDRSNRTWLMVETLGEASATYLAAAADAQYHSRLFTFIRYLFIARRLSNKMLKLAGGAGGLTAGQLGVRAEIFRRGRSYKPAARCLETALSRSGLPDDTRVALLTRLMIIEWRRHKKKLPDEILREIERAIGRGRVPPSINLRFLRTKAKLLEESGESWGSIHDTVTRAMRLIVKHNLPREELDWRRRVQV